jgi:(4S)-4-hydroxy-5-phosphonooxypentane-2,3-dione isomerase
MGPKAILVQITIRSGCLERFEELVLTNARLSLRDEPGCQRFDVLVAADDQRRIVLYEIYDDASAFEAHLNTPHYRDFATGTRDMVDASALTTLDFLRSDPMPRSEFSGASPGRSDERR